MTKSEVNVDTHKITTKKGKKQGKFEAETQIGFHAVNFAYVSKVTYVEPSQVLSVGGETAIFNELYSLWEIEKLD